MAPSSAIPDFYYFWFAAYEPFLTVMGFIGTCMYVGCSLVWSFSQLIHISLKRSHFREPPPFLFLQQLNRYQLDPQRSSTMAKWHPNTQCTPTRNYSYHRPTRARLRSRRCHELFHSHCNPQTSLLQPRCTRKNSSSTIHPSCHRWCLASVFDTLGIRWSKVWLCELESYAMDDQSPWSKFDASTDGLASWYRSLRWYERWISNENH